MYIGNQIKYAIAQKTRKAAKWREIDIQDAMYFFSNLIDAQYLRMLGERTIVSRLTFIAVANLGVRDWQDFSAFSLKLKKNPLVPSHYTTEANIHGSIGGKKCKEGSNFKNENTIIDFVI